MNRRTFVSRLGAGVLACALLRDALLGRLFEPEPVVSAADFTLEADVWHHLEIILFGDGRAWRFLDGRRLDGDAWPPLTLNDGDALDVTTTFKRAD